MNNWANWLLIRSLVWTSWLPAHNVAFPSRLDLRPLSSRWVADHKIEKTRWALLTSLRLAWKWKDATLYQNGVTLFEGDKVVLWHGIEVTDSTSKLNQSGDKLLPMWLSLGIRFQNPSVSGFVLPTLCAWLGVGTRPVCSDCQHIFLPRNPSFYQQAHLSTNKPIFLPKPHFSTNKTNPSFYQQIQSTGHTHLPTKPAKS